MVAPVRRDLSVAVGALLGAGSRWAALWLAGPSGAAVTVLAINVAGAAVLGALAGSTARRRASWVDAVVGAGFCGALTTWSTLAVQVAGELRDGRWATGGAWLAANLVLGVSAAALGHLFARDRIATGSSWRGGNR